MRAWSPPQQLLPLPCTLPQGLRTPNGLVWASTRDGLCKAHGKCWSMSMIQELKKKRAEQARRENSESGDLEDVEDSEPQETPHVLQPWGVLRLTSTTTAPEPEEDEKVPEQEQVATTEPVKGTQGEEHLNSNEATNQDQLNDGAPPKKQGSPEDSGMCTHGPETSNAPQACATLAKVCDEDEDSGIDMSYDDEHTIRTPSLAGMMPQPALGDEGGTSSDGKLNNTVNSVMSTSGATLSNADTPRHHRRDSGIVMSADEEDTSGCEEWHVVEPQEAHEESSPDSLVQSPFSTAEPEYLQGMQDGNKTAPLCEKQSETPQQPETALKEETPVKCDNNQPDIKAVDSKITEVIMKEGAENLVLVNTQAQDSQSSPENKNGPDSQLGPSASQIDSAPPAKDTNTSAESVRKEAAARAGPSEGGEPQSTVTDGSSPTPGVNSQKSSEEHDITEETRRFPKLAEFLPPEYFPEALIVNDPEGYTGEDCKDLRPTGIKYKRLFPPIDREDMSDTPADPLPFFPSDEPRSLLTGYLDLNVPTLGKGNHALVYRAILRLPEPIGTPTGPVAVAAKLSSFSTEDLEMLYNEGYSYNRCPKHLQEDWSGYNHIRETEYHDRDGVFPALGVVPKFYGFYVPVQEDNEPIHKNTGPQLVRNWLRKEISPILLVEECGEPIHTSKLRGEDRAFLFSFAYRLHHASMFQGSFYTRNVLRQPGPLHVPPEKRSDDTPSFRIIDFGRARFQDNWMEFDDCEDDWDSYYSFTLKQAKNAIFGYVDDDNCRPYW